MTSLDLKKKGERSKDSAHMISYKVSSDLKPVGAIIKEIQGIDSINNRISNRRKVVKVKSEPTKICKPDDFPTL